MRILVATAVFPDTLAQLRASHDVIEAVDCPADELRRLVVDRQVIIFRSGIQVTAEVMDLAPDLELLIRAGSGIDNIDLAHADARGLRLERIPGPGARAVAELAFGLMLGLARQIRRADELLRNGHWAKHEIQGQLLADKTLGVYGAGNIGALIGELGRAWGMRAVGCIEHPSTERAEQLAARGVELLPPEQVLAEADFLSINVPLQESTRNVIGAEAFARMKPGVILVNLARGGVVNESALVAALESGHVAGAGLDVHEHEGEGVVSPLASLPNVILTPHMGAGTVDSQRRIGERVLEILNEHRGATASG